MADLNTSQRVSVTLVARQADKPDGTPGDPATVQAGSIVWASSDETVVVAVPDPADGMTGFINAVAVGGPARVVFTADADMGAGTVTITGTTEDINVTQDPATFATSFTITLGAPEAKVPAGP